MENNIFSSLKLNFSALLFRLLIVSEEIQWKYVTMEIFKLANYLHSQDSLLFSSHSLSPPSANLT
jgi:hypothetical protein